MMIRHVKTAVLVILVAVSLALSYVLWQGNWQSTDNLSVTESANLKPAANPTDADTVVPYQIVFTSRDANLHAVGMPDSPVYSEWMTRLRSVRISNLHPVDWTTQHPQTEAVAYQLGGSVSTRHIVHWFPTLVSMNNAPRAVQSIYLYVDTANQKGTPQVDIRVDADDVSYVGATNVTPDQFQQDLSTLVKQDPWVEWNPGGNTYIPAKSTTLPVFHMDVTKPQILPLVNSFFLNPQALTRLQEGSSTVLWTDGSQVVWWDTADETLTYADPSHTQASPPVAEDINRALSYIRNHGGTRENTVLFGTEDNGASTAYSLRTYLNGVPILGSNEEYHIEMESGRVIQYQRPLADFTARTGESTVKIIGADQLTKRLESVLPLGDNATDHTSLTVELGYAVSPESDGSVTLSPVYYVTKSGELLGILDAQDGNVLQGMVTP